MWVSTTRFSCSGSLARLRAANCAVGSAQSTCPPCSSTRSTCARRTVLLPVPGSPKQTMGRCAAFATSSLAKCDSASEICCASRAWWPRNAMRLLSTESSGSLAASSALPQKLKEAQVVGTPSAFHVLLQLLGRLGPKLWGSQVSLPP